MDRPFIVGTGRESTQAAVRAAKRAAELGADAVLVRTPGFFKTQMTSDAFVRHYTAVADASPVPVLLYNFTALTGVEPAAGRGVAPRGASQHHRHEGIGRRRRADRGSRSIVPDRFSVLAGSPGTFHGALLAGVIGGILALGVRRAGGVRPAVRAHARRTARRRADPSAAAVPLAKLFGSAYGVPGLKAALNLSGFDVGYPRPPLTPLPGPAVAALRQALRAAQEIPA